MPSSGIMTAPMQVDYHDVLRVWREADTLPEIEHAWLFDPASITRSIHLQVSYDDPGSIRKAIAEAASLLTLTPLSDR
jgi:hypothetical protein